MPTFYYNTRINKQKNLHVIIALRWLIRHYKRHMRKQEEIFGSVLEKRIIESISVDTSLKHLGITKRDIEGGFIARENQSVIVLTAQLNKLNNWLKAVKDTHPSEMSSTLLAELDQIFLNLVLATLLKPVKNRTKADVLNALVYSAALRAIGNSDRLMEMSGQVFPFSLIDQL